MKTPFSRSKPALPQRPTFPIEARLAELHKQERALLQQIIAAEQTNFPAGDDDDDSLTIDREAYALISIEGTAQKPRKPPTTLRSLRHDRQVILRAIELGSNQLGDLKVAWASAELTSRLADYRAMTKALAIHIASARKIERERQAFIQSFGLAGARSSLPVARFGLAMALGDKSAGPLHEFITAAIAAGLVTKKEIEDV
jgi:hypothetical protein